MMMLKLVVLLALAVTLNAFGPSTMKVGGLRSMLDMKVGLYFGTSTGNTENVASIIAKASSEIDIVASIEEFGVIKP